MKSISVRKGAILALTHALVACVLNLCTTNSVVAFDQPWNGGREDITRPEEDEEEECESGECSCPSENNTSSPVYSARGYLVWKDTDIQFPSGTTIGLSRTYNSFDFRAGLFGRGWITAQESNIALTYKALTEGNADGSSKPAESYESIPIWSASYGRRYRLEETETGCKTPDVLYFTFEKTANGDLKQVFENSNSYVLYNDKGQMVSSYSDRTGSSIYYTYDEQSRLVEQFDSFGFRLEFSYNDSGFVSVVKDQAGRQWYYSYDEFGRLSQMQDPDGNTKDYTYQIVDQTGYKQHLLTEVNDNINNPVLRVTWSEVKLYGKNAQRVKSYTEVDGRTHEYIYTQATYQNVPAVKVVKNTKQVNSTTVIESHTIHAEASTYRILNAADTTKATTVSKKYNNRSRLVELIDERGNKTIYEYDDLNRRVKQTELAGTPDEKITTWTYSGTTDRFQAITKYGLLETRYTYDDNLRVTSSTQTELATGEKRVWAYTYHPNTTDPQGNTVLGKVATIDGPQLGAQDVQSLAYNARGQLIRVDYPLGHSITFAYNAAGQLASQTDFNDVVSSFIYDSRNRLTRLERDNRAVHYTYSPRGQITQMVDELGRVTKMEYNARNQPAKVTFPDGGYLTFTYTFVAQHTEVVEKAFTADDTLLRTRISRSKPETGLPKEAYLATTTQKVSEREYNGLDDLTKQTLYGQFGTKTASVSTFSYDAEGRLHRILDDLSGITLLDYDVFGRLTKITDPNQAVTEYALNVWGDPQTLASPDTGTTQYVYDAAGNLSQKVDAHGRSTRFSYDELNRVTSVDHDGEALDVSLTYDEGQLGKGHLTSATDAISASSFGYDGRGLITQSITEVAGVSLPVGYSYDDAGQLTDLTYPSGLTLKTRYDDAGRLAGIDRVEGSTTTTVLDQIVWLGRQLSSHRQGNGLITTYFYDTAGRLTEKRFGGTSERFQIQLDTQGNILQKTEVRSGQSVLSSFDYDSLGRLTRDGTPGWDWLFSYDAVGNRMGRQKTSGADALTYAYHARSNRLDQIGSQPQMLDATGNTLSDGTAQFTYDARNRLQSVSSVTAQAQYFYNFKGERVRKQVTGDMNTDIRYVYGQRGEMLGEYDVDGNRIREILYRYDGTLPEPIAQIEANGDIHYLHTDHLSTPRIASNANQVIVWRWISSAFGEGEPAEDVDGNGELTVINLRFPGQYFDMETGLHYNYFRDYDPTKGRYIESDPVGLDGGLNTYLYAEANPLWMVDFNGLNSGPGLGDQWNPGGSRDNENVKDYKDYFDSRFPKTIAGALKLFAERIKEKICATGKIGSFTLPGLSGGADDIDIASDMSRFGDASQGWWERNVQIGNFELKTKAITVNETTSSCPQCYDYSTVMYLLENTGDNRLPGFKERHVNMGEWPLQGHICCDL